MMETLMVVLRAMSPGTSPVNLGTPELVEPVGVPVEILIQLPAIPQRDPRDPMESCRQGCIAREGVPD